MASTDTEILAFILNGPRQNHHLFCVGFTKQHVKFLFERSGCWKRHQRKSMWKYWKGDDCLEVVDVLFSNMNGQVADTDKRYRTLSVESPDEDVVVIRQQCFNAANAIMPCSSEFDNVQHIAAGFFIKHGCSCVLRVEAIRDTGMPDATWYCICVVGQSHPEVLLTAREIVQIMNMYKRSSDEEDYQLDERTVTNINDMAISSH